MITKPIVLLLISTTTFISLKARSEGTPLFTILGKDVMRNEVNLNAEPSEAALKSIDRSYPDGRPMNWADCYSIGAVMNTIVPTINDKFISDNNLQVTEQDIADYISRIEVVIMVPGTGRIITNDLDAETRQLTESTAALQLSSWKYYVAVYEKYGGRIATTGDGDVTPIDAVLAQFKESENQGMFTIHDNELRALFWTCITNIPITFLEEAEGLKALYKHPADILMSKFDVMMSNTTAKVQSIIEPREDNDLIEENEKTSEHAPPEGRGEAPRP